MVIPPNSPVGPTRRKSDRLPSGARLLIRNYAEALSVSEVSAPPTAMETVAPAKSTPPEGMRPETNRMPGKRVLAGAGPVRVLVYVEAPLAALRSFRPSRVMVVISRNPSLGTATVTAVGQSSADSGGRRCPNVAGYRGYSPRKSLNAEKAAHGPPLIGLSAWFSLASPTGFEPGLPP